MTRRCEITNLGHCDRALLAIADQRAADDDLELRRDVRAFGPDRWRRRRQHRLDNRQRIGSNEQPPASQHFVRDDAQRPQVGARIDGVTPACSGDM